MKPCLDRLAVSKLQQLAAQQRVDEQVIDYAVRMVRATRDWPGVAMGSGSRGALALVRGARAVALFDGRDYAFDSGLDERLCAWRGPCLMGVRFERDVGGTSASTLSRLFKRERLGMF